LRNIPVNLRLIVHVAGRAALDDLLSRMFSYFPVSPMEVLIEEMQVTKNDSDRFFVHRSNRSQCSRRCPGEGRLRLRKNERQA
jgi:hypothetical protein